MISWKAFKNSGNSSSDSGNKVQKTKHLGHAGAGSSFKF